MDDSLYSNDMISVIVCSRSNRISPVFENNIRHTIGVEYELVHIDNSANEYSIFEAYNTGIKQSKYPYLCLVHEDVEFHSYKWGIRMIKHLQDEQVGIIGVAGCALISTIPGQWNDFYQSMQIIQSSGERKHKKKRILKSHGLTPAPWPVVALDGVMLCMRKNLTEKIIFDETLPGFHAYDLDICLQAHQAGYRNLVINDILIEHFSKGCFKKDYYLNTFRVFDKWKHILPAHIPEISDEKANQLIRQNIGRLTGHLMKVMLRMQFSNEEIRERIYLYINQYGHSGHQLLFRFFTLRSMFVLYNSRFRRKMFQ
jgi:hypothetical protein